MFYLHCLERLPLPYKHSLHTAVYLQEPNWTSSIDTIATGWDIPEFPIVHVQSGENFAL